MSKAIIVVAILALAFCASAQDLSSHHNLPVKQPTTAPPVPAPSTRVGGDDIATAVPIASLPFSDTGNTCNFTDDYDEVCDYSGSTSPDVVYSYAAASDMAIVVDLCGSLYDTKTYIYDGSMQVVACNDDYYYDEVCGSFTSYLEAWLPGGETYYIVVDGYGGQCGDYFLNVSETAVCQVACGPDAVPEGEPPLVDYYIDALNGGCNSDPPVYQPIDWINVAPGDPGDGCAWLCARSGWYYAGVDSRDTDWFPVTAASDGTMEFTVQSELPVNIFVLNNDCSNILVLYDSTTVGECGTATIEWPVLAGEVYVLWVGPTTFTGPVNEFNYTMRVCGSTYSTVSTEVTSWGAVKGTYR